MVRDERLKRQPEFDPDGWLALRHAFNRFAVAAIGTEWLGAFNQAEKVIDAEELPPLVSVSYTEVRNDHVNAPVNLAQFYTRALCLAFAAAARSGSLTTAYARKGAGDIHSMPLGAWRTDTPFIRFKGWSFDPEDPGATGLRLSHWVFVNAEDLAAVERDLQAWREGLPLYDGEEIETDGLLCRCPTPARLVPLGDVLLVEAPTFPQFDGRGRAAPITRLPANDRAVGPRLGRDEYYAWVTTRVREGASQKEVVDATKRAFPHHDRRWLNREKIRAIYSEVRISEGLGPPKQGPRSA